MNCPWHPSKRAVTSCKDCGSEFCIECVRETDQTVLCPDCFRRKIGEITREFAEPEERKVAGEEAAPAPAYGGGPSLAAEEEPSPFEEETLPGVSYGPAPRSERRPAAQEARKGLFAGRGMAGRKRKAGEPPPPRAPEPPALFQEEEAPPVPKPPTAEAVTRPPAGIRAAPPADTPRPVPSDAALRAEEGAWGGEGETGRGKVESETPAPAEDFLSQGPDEDFSMLAEGMVKRGRWLRRRRDEVEAAQGPRSGEILKAEEAEVGAAQPAAEARATLEEARPQRGAEQEPRETAALPSDDELLQDVMSTLLRPEAGEAVEATAPAAGVAATAETLPAPAGAVRRKAVARERESRARREKDAERWAFLAQPRASDYTLIAVSWWRATLFVALMLALGAVLWAVPNAYLIPKDQEYGLHAVAIGAIIGLAFWWKAGKKHSTKLAVQAALTTLFAIFIGEFLHWFLIITKYKAFRTIFFDLISFRFLWENGAQILRYTVEAMFPLAFLWLLLMPTVTAFIIGYGMPPIPEIFFQIRQALKRRAPGEEEATHGVEG